MYSKKHTSWLAKSSLIAILTILFGIVLLFAFESLDKLCKNILPRIWLSIISILIIWLIYLYLSYFSLQKELQGKTKKCLSIKYLSPLSKQLLNEHINKANTIAMNYGSNEETIAELTRLNIITPYDKINHRINFWFFECLDKNLSLLDYET